MYYEKNMNDQVPNTIPSNQVFTTTTRKVRVVCRNVVLHTAPSTGSLPHKYIQNIESSLCICILKLS